MNSIPSTTKEFLFIDANVADKQTLIDSVASNVKVVELNDKSNVLDQMVAALKGQKNLDAIHIISHGSEGELDFASGALNSSNLSNYTDQLKKIGNALSATGDILLYGCDVAKGSDGNAFINSIANLTKADVAASDDLTGASWLGGDWALEYQVGELNTKSITPSNYNYSLTVPSRITNFSYSASTDVTPATFKPLSSGTLTKADLSGTGWDFVMDYYATAANVTSVYFRGLPAPTYDAGGGGGSIRMAAGNSSDATKNGSNFFEVRMDAPNYIFDLNSFYLRKNSAGNITIEALDSSYNVIAGSATTVNILLANTFQPISLASNTKYVGIYGFRVSGYVKNSDGPYFDTLVADNIRTNINTPPTFTGGANAGLTVLEDAATTTITTAMLQVKDAEQLASALTYTVTTLPTKGTLTNNGVAVALNGTFTQANIDSGLIKFTPSANANGSDSVGFSVSDGTVSISGTFGLTITPVNDAPTISVTSWTPAGTAGFSAGATSYESLAIDASGTPYLVYQDGANSSKATVMKFTNGAWSVVGTAGFSAGSTSYESLAIDASGIPYLAYADGFNSNKATVMKFTNNAWSVVGTAVSAGSASYESLAIDASGTPYLAYQDAANASKATVMKFTNGAWSVVGTAGFSAGATSYESLAIDASGVPYLAYQDGANSSKATVMKFINGAWSVVGTAGFSAGVPQYESLAIDATGTPYLAYQDGANASKATVMKFTNGVWSLVGTAGLSAGITYNESLAIDASGIPYLAYQDGSNSSKATVMMGVASVLMPGINKEYTLTTLLNDSNLAYTDIDSTLRGVAVTQVSGTGTWQYSTDSGVSWNTIGTVSQTNALLLAETNTKLRYLINTASPDQGSLAFRAWDQSTGTPTSGSTQHSADVSINGNSTAFSKMPGVFTVTDTAPTLTSISILTAGGAGASSMTISYADLLAAANAADADGDALSFRIEAVTTGTLTKNGTAVTAGSTFISSGDSVVWTPATGAAGNTNAFAVKAFDGVKASTTAVPVSVGLPVLTSATYDALSNTLTVTGSNMVTGDTIAVSKLTLRGETMGQYTLTSSDVTASSSTSFSVILNAADQINVEGLFNKDGSTSVSLTPYALQAAANWDTARLSLSTNKSVTVSNVQKPTITNATYDVVTGVLTVTGTDFVKQVGANNDIDLSKLNLSGQGGTYRPSNNTANVEISSSTSFSVTLGAIDKAAVNLRLDKAGESSTGGTIYNLAAMDNWNGVITPASGADISDLTNNPITVIAPSNGAPTFATVTKADATVLTGVNLTLSLLEDATITTIPNLALKVVDAEQLPAALVYKLSALPTKGTLTLNNVAANVNDTFTQADIDNNLIKYTPTLNANGSDSFAFSVSDGAGGILNSQTFNISITAVNDAPVAIDDAGTAVEAGGINNAENATPVTGNVKTNDSDVDGDALTITEVRTGGTVNSGTAGTIGSALVGTYGSLTLNADGSYTYAVNNSNPTVDALKSGESLTDSFNYTVSDGQATATAVLTMTINGSNDTPTMSNLNGDAADFWLGSTSRIPLDLNQNMTLTDPDSANYNGSTLSVGFALGQNHVLGTGSLTVDGSNFKAIGYSGGYNYIVFNGGLAGAVTALFSSENTTPISSTGETDFSVNENVGFVSSQQVTTTTLGVSTNVGTRYTFNSIGTVSTADANGFSITLNANATPANVQSFIRNLYYLESLSDTTGAGRRSFNIQLTDSSSTVMNPATVTLTEKIPVPTITLTIDTGSSNTDKITKTGTFSIANLVSNVTPATTWQYSSDGGTTWFDGTGTTFTVLGEGVKTVVARQLDGAKKTSANSTPITLTLDNTNPASPVLSLTQDAGSSATDRITNNSEITVSNLETGASWEYSLDGGSNWVNGSGTTIPATAITGDGAKSITVRQTDLAGNVSAISNAFTFTLDKTVAAPTLALAADTGNASDKITSNGTLNVSGLEAGATWKYSLDNGTTWTTGSGSNFTLTGDGAKSVIVQQTDLAGNVSANSTALVFTLDTTVAAPTLVLTDTGSNSSDKITNNATVTLGGLEATWEYSLDGSSWHAGTGSSYTFTDGDGVKSITVRQTDVAANVSNNSATLKFTLDTTSPVKPVLTLVSDTAVNNDGVTSNGKITVTNLESGATWEYITDGTTWTTGGGDNFTLSTDGANQNVVVRQTDAAGNSTTSDPLVITLDTKAVAPTLALATDTGKAGDKITSDSTVNVSGIETGASWQYSLDAGSNWLNGTGTTITGITGDGEKSITVRQTDLAGNVSASSAAFTFVLNSGSAITPTLALATDTGTNTTDKITYNGTVNVSNLENGATWQYKVGSGSWIDGSGTSFTLSGDAVGKSVVVQQTNVIGNSASSAALVFTLDTSVVAPTIALTSDTGTSNSDRLTSNSEVTVTGLESGATWEYKIGTGIWTAGTGTTIPASAITIDGDYSVIVRQTDVAGNVSENSAALNFTLAANNVATSGITLATDSGSSSTDGITNTKDVNVSGLTGAASWEYQINGGSWTTGGTITGDTNSLTLIGSDAADGNKAIAVRQTNGAGVTGASSTIFNFVLDTTITAPTLSITDTAITTDSITSNAIVTVSGLEDGATWKYSLDNGTNWINGVGSSFTLTSDGAKSILVQQTDVAGNNAISNTPLTFTLDTTIATPTLALTNDTGTNGDLVTKNGSVTISNLESGGTWRYSTDAGLNWSNWTAATTSTFELTSDGKKSVIVEQKDVAGNSSTQSTPLDFTLDTSVVVPTFAFTDTSSNNAKITSNGKVTVSGLEDGATWQYSVDDGTNWIAGSGDNVILKGDGVKVFRVKQTDLAGNVSNASSSTTFTLDTKAVAPTLALTNDTNVTTDKITSNGAVTVSGIETGASWQYSVDNGGTWTTGGNVASDGTSSITGLTGDGEKSILVKQTDVAGNISLISPKFTFTLDTSTATPTLALAQDTNSNTDNITSNGKVMVTGLESGATWQYSLDGVIWTTGSSDNVTLTDDDEKYIIVKQTDAAGNTATSAPLTFTLDTTVVAPIISLAEDTGKLSTDGITSNKTVNVFGIEGGATWEYSLDGTTWSSGSGSSYTFTTGDGIKSITVRQKDVAGNQSDSSSTLSFTVDTVTTKPTLSFVDTGTSNSDGVTQNGKVTVANLESGATWEYSNDGTTWSVGNGDSVTLTEDGNKTIRVRATDAAGNTQTSDILTFKLDATAATPVLSLEKDTGKSDSDFVTSDGVVNIANLEDGTWEYSLNDGKTWTTGTGTNLTLT